MATKADGRRKCWISFKAPIENLKTSDKRITGASSNVSLPEQNHCSQSLYPDLASKELTNVLRLFYFSVPRTNHSVKIPSEEM